MYSAGVKLELYWLYHRRHCSHLRGLCSTPGISAPPQGSRFHSMGSLLHPRDLEVSAPPPGIRALPQGSRFHPQGSLFHPKGLGSTFRGLCSTPMVSVPLHRSRLHSMGLCSTPRVSAPPQGSRLHPRGLGSTLGISAPPQGSLIHPKGLGSTPSVSAPPHGVTAPPQGPRLHTRTRLNPRRLCCTPGSQQYNYKITTV